MHISKNAVVTDDEYEKRWDAIALQLGYIVIFWSRIEFYLARAFFGVTEATEAASNVLARRLNASTIETIILELLPAIPEDEATAIRAWVKKIQAARKWRNSSLHSILVDQKRDGAWHPSRVEFGIGKDGAARISGEKITLAELTSFREDLGTIAKEYRTLPERARIGIQQND